MNRSILCQGCGKRVTVPDDYQRRKMQCPACGVMGEVPEDDRAAPTSSPKRAAKRKADSTTPAPAVAATSTPSAPPVDLTAPIRGDFLDHDFMGSTEAPAQQITLVCGSCGYRMQVPASSKDRNRRCHRCGGRVTETTATHPARMPPPVAGDLDEDDGQPYTVSGPPERHCPNCQRVVPPESPVCSGCGFNIDTGEQPAPKTYDLIERAWDAGWPLGRRVRVWIAGQVVFWILTGALGSWLGHDLSSIIWAWVGFTFLLTFSLGTYDRIEFRRNERGKVRLTQTWRVFFFRRPPTRIQVGGCDGVITGHSYQVGFLDWMVLISLLFMGIIPGVIWFFGFMQRDTYHAALTRDHGFPEHLLYKGWSKDQAADIAHTIADATGLPYEGF